jgi:hypothetical protein
MGWSPEQSDRRSMLSGGLVGGILVLQAALTIRLHNAASPGELMALNDFRVGDYYPGNVSFYPSIASAFVSTVGMQALRALSLVLMLGTTTFLYLWTHRLFNERVGLAAAAAYAMIASTAMLGALATSDALALFLLAAATWLVVESIRGQLWPLLVAPVVVILAVLVKSAAFAYLPTIVLLALLVSVRRGFSPAAMLRVLPLIVAVAIAAVLVGTASPDAPASLPFSTLVDGAVHWTGSFALFAMIGCVLYGWKARMVEVPTATPSEDSSRAWRICLGLVLSSPVLLAPIYLLQMPALETLWKQNLGYGALFAATMVGVGLVRIVGSHFRYPQLGIMAAVLLLAVGMAQSMYEYSQWPDSSKLISVLRAQLKPGERYLASSPEIITYYLKDSTEKSRWRSMKNTDYSAGVKKRTFDLIVLEVPAASVNERKIQTQLRSSGRYRLLTSVPYQLGWTPGGYEIWVKESSSSLPAKQ